MFRTKVASALVALGTISPVVAEAEGRVALGEGRLVNNDFIGDGHDRWHTGSIALSYVRGPEWDGALPYLPGQLLEYRLGSAIMAPSNLRTPSSLDRPYAGALSLGLHTHFQRGGNDISLGADLVMTGPSTGLGAFQTAVHDALDLPAPSKETLDNQIEDGFHPTLVAEMGRDFSFSNNTTLRPFIEGRYGVENMVRVGADLTLGTVGQGELLVRDGTTGQRYRTIDNDLSGFSFVLGGDIARVTKSTYLPEDDGFDLTETRNRARAGVHWQSEKGHQAFYGLTWMGKEFEAQTEGQVVGSVRIKVKF